MHVPLCLCRHTWRDPPRGRHRSAPHACASLPQPIRQPIGACVWVDSNRGCLELTQPPCLSLPVFPYHAYHTTRPPPYKRTHIYTHAHTLHTLGRTGTAMRLQTVAASMPATCRCALRRLVCLPLQRAAKPTRAPSEPGRRRSCSDTVEVCRGTWIRSMTRLPRTALP